MVVLLLASFSIGRATDAGRWMKYRGSHVTVFSRAPEGVTRNWVIEFERMYAGMAAVFPEVGTAQPPLSAVLFDKRAEFADYRPIYNGKVFEVNGYFSRLTDRGFVALDISEGRGEASRVIRHEAVHWFFSADPKLRPTWFEEGMAELFSTVQVKDGQFIYGDVVAVRLDSLEHGSMLDVAHMLRVTHDTLGFNEANRMAPFYDSAWLFMHYVAFSGEGGGFPVLRKYLELLEEEMRPEDAFQQAFGCDYQAMDQKLGKYIGRAKQRRFTAALPPSKVDGQVEMGVADVAEVDRELGCLLAVAGREEQAKVLLEKAAASTPDNYLLQEAQGILASLMGDREAAKRHFDRALELGSRSYNCHLGPAMAELTYRESRGGALGSLSPAAARIIANGLVKTIEMEPGREVFYSNLALALFDVADISEEEGRLMEQGKKRFPRNLDVCLGYALFQRKMGRDDEALAEFDRISGTLRQVPERLRYAARSNALLLRIATVSARYESCLAKRDFDGAISALDERIGLKPVAMEASRLRAHRAELVDRRDMTAVNRLQAADRLAEARPLLERLARESSNETLRNEASRLLRELEPAPGTKN